MPDVVSFGIAPNTTVEIFGLIARTDEIRAATREAGRFIGDRLAAAQNALGDWRGPHSDLFAPEVNRLLEQLGELRDLLELSAAMCGAVPDGPAAGGGVPPPKVSHPHPGLDDSSAKPKLLNDYATVSEAQDADVGALAAAAKVSDLRAVVHREQELALAEQAIAVVEGTTAGEIEGMGEPTTTETTADEYIWLPDVPAMLEGFAARSGGFAGWVREVATAFATADTGRKARLVWLGKLVGYDDGTPDLLVGDATGPGSAVLKLKLRELPPAMTAVEWAWVFEAAGIGADRRPIHFVMHGWGSNADGAARSVAARYDARGVDAVVIAVDWDAGEGFSVGDPGDFNDAERQGARTGDVFAGALSGLALTAKEADVAVTAHSLGNHVAMRGISQYSDPSGEFKIANYTAIQPAVPDYVADLPAYNGAFGERVEDLTLTINNNDFSLGLYETTTDVTGSHDPSIHGGEALGDEAYDGNGIEKIRQLRGDQPFTIIDHDSDVGRGHLGLDPSGSGLVSTVVGAQVDDLSGQSSVSEDAHEFLSDRYTSQYTNDVLLEEPGIRAYIEEQAAKGEPIDEAKLTSLVDDAVGHKPSGPGVETLPPGPPPSDQPNPEPTPAPPGPAPTPPPAPTPTH